MQETKRLSQFSESRHPPRYSSLVFDDQPSEETDPHHSFLDDNQPSNSTDTHHSVHLNNNNQPSRSTDTHHSFHLKNSKGRKWAYIHLQKSEDKPSGTAKNIPVLIEGADNMISGTVTLDLESPEMIQGLTISVRGRAITGANEGGTYMFLNYTMPLWSKNQGDPQGYAGTGQPRSKDNKLFGTYFFPFSFSLPRTFDSSGPWGAGVLPESFYERASGVRVQYELVLKIERGRLRSNAKLELPVLYRRRISPSVPSELRQVAHRKKIPVPGPDVDLDRWSTFSPVDCVGCLLNSRTVVLRCSLSLPNPLQYTRGSFIPCRLRIESVDEQALDLLASPRTTTLRLSRRIRYMHDAGQGMQQNKASMASKPKYEISDIGQAIWLHEEDKNDSRARYLVGEIHLPKELPPSSDIVPFGVEYTVGLLPFESAAFSPSGENLAPLQTHKVEIVTEFGPGPVPIARTSPIEWATPTAEELNNPFLRSGPMPWFL